MSMYDTLVYSCLLAARAARAALGQSLSQSSNE
jgi:hypothetical protein